MDILEAYDLTGVAVADTKADSHEVYANYDRYKTTGFELRNSSGNGTTVYGPLNESDPVYGIQSCVAIDFWPDDCGLYAH